jgi:FkbM family methyltransferase
MTSAAGATRDLTFVDIGARWGLPRHWRRLGDRVRVVAFEPDADEAERLAAGFRAQGADAVVLPTAVWSAASNETLCLTREPGCSSLYEPNREFLDRFPKSDRFDVARRVSLETTSLDDALRSASTAGLHFIKLDAQGGAFAILSGATETLRSTIGLEIEVEFAPMYRGEPLFGAVDDLLRGRGFELVDMRPTYWRRREAMSMAGVRGQLVFGDVLYMLSPEALVALLRACDATGARTVARAAAVACDAYGLEDWRAVYRAAATAANLDAEVVREFGNAHPAAVPRFAGWLPASIRHRAGLLLKDLGDALLEPSGAWAWAEQRIGSKMRITRNSR